MTNFIANDNYINARQYETPDNCETQIQQQEHVEKAKNVTKSNSQEKVKVSDDYETYHAEFIRKLSEFNSV